MRMRNVGPKTNITRSMLEEPRKKVKRKKEKLGGDDLTYRILARKDPEDLSADESRELKELKKKRKERRQKRDREAMEMAEANDKRVDKEAKGMKKKEKKLSKSRDLVVSVGAGGLSVKEKRQLAQQAESYFGANSVKIMDMLENGDADSGITVLKKTLLMTIIRVLPMAEQILSDSGTAKGTYQFVTLISQMRELMADIQADKDKQFLAQSVCEQIIRPAFMNMAQNMLTAHHDFRKKGDMFVLPAKSSYFSEQLLALGKEIAKHMQGEYTEVSTKLVEALKN